MPDAVPTERVPNSGKPAKKLSKTAIIGIGAGAVVLLYLFKKKKQKEEEETGPNSPYTSQSFIPVTGENVAGVGAGGSSGFGGETGSGALIESQKNYQELIASFLTQETESRRESEANNREFFKGLEESLRSQTGGGPPGEGQNGSGGGSGGGGSGPTPTKKPAPPPPSKAPVGYNKVKCGNGCEGHEYPHGKDGHSGKVTECQTKKGGKCSW